MKREQIAAQLYTVRDYTKSPSEIAATLKKIKEIGYNAVELSGVEFIEDKELTNIIFSEGLVCCGIHEKYDMIIDEPEKTAERLMKFSATYCVYPHSNSTDNGSKEAIKTLAKKLNASGKILHRYGAVLCYHNHSFEFRHVDGKKTSLEMIFEETDGEFLKAELDTYWIQAAGASPLEWCIKLDGRLPLVHLKDFAVNSENKSVMAEVGRGNINWGKIVSAASKSGCQWFIVEQDKNWIHNDPFASLKSSYDYITSNLCC